eukprot:3810034-Pleurochrysis_carterae.AAC.4
MSQRARSVFETLKSRSGLSTSIRPLTAMKTMDASAAYGRERSAGVKNRTTVSTTAHVNKEWSGVQSPPALVATKAERESEPEIGKDEKKEPAMLANPSATSSWFESAR